MNEEDLQDLSRIIAALLRKKINEKAEKHAKLILGSLKKVDLNKEDSLTIEVTLSFSASELRNLLNERDTFRKTLRCY